MSLQFIAHIVAATPLWVFALFAYLARQGYQRLSPRAASFQRILLVPAFFIAWGLYGLYERSTDGQGPLIWFVAACAGGLLGFLTNPRRLQVDRRRNLVLQPGSVLPLLRYTLLFGGHYGLHIAMAMRPGDRAILGLWDVALSGLGAGYFLGWLVGFVRTRRTAPEADLSAYQAATGIAEAAR